MPANSFLLRIGGHTLSVDAHWAAIEREARNCKACALASNRTNVVIGVGNKQADLMFIGEGPGVEEDRLGEPFVGRSGQLLDRLLAEELGIDRSVCYIANIVKCRPPMNRNPLPQEMAACRHFLDTQIQLVDPRVIVTLGNVATKAILGYEDGITKLRGKSYPWNGRIVVPTYHPAAALRQGGQVVTEMRADLVRAKLLLNGRSTV